MAGRAPQRRPVLRQVIGAPVLVSTMDYLINAGEPGRQGHHVSALLRMVDSDLVLDEVDSYAPDALVAVLRVVQSAGLMGRQRDLLIGHLAAAGGRGGVAGVSQRRADALRAGRAAAALWRGHCR